MHMAPDERGFDDRVGPDEDVVGKFEWVVRESPGEKVGLASYTVGSIRQKQEWCSPRKTQPPVTALGISREQIYISIDDIRTATKLTPCIVFQVGAARSPC
jgi:hypothetical protein